MGHVTDPTPQDLERRAEREGVTLKGLVAAIPRECREISPARAWGGLLRALATIAALQVGLAMVPLRADASLAWSAPALAALWCLAGWAMAGLFVIGHDCGHMAFSRRRWVNVAVGHLCMAPLYASFHAWILGHNHHHVHTNVRKVETNWPEQMLTVDEYRRAPPGKRLEVLLAFGSFVGVLIGNWVGLTRYMFADKAYPQMGRLPRRDRRALRVSNAITLAVTGGIVAGLWVAFGFWPMLKHYWVPVCIAATTGGVFTLLHHVNEDALVFEADEVTPFRAQVLSTFDVRYPRVVEWLCFDIQLHLVHHLTPRVPWYHLRAATRAVREAYPGYVQERRFSLALLRRLWSRPVLRHHPEGYYTFSPVPAAAEAVVPEPVP